MSYHPSIVETLAEELVDVRAAQARLKAREAELREALSSLAAPAQGRVQIPTRAGGVQIETRSERRFDARRLPDGVASVSFRSFFPMVRVCCTATVALCRPSDAPIPSACAAADTNVTAERSTDRPKAPNIGRV